MDDLWKDYAGDFNSMTDLELKLEVELAEDIISEQTDFIEAYNSWVAEGKPRDE